MPKLNSETYTEDKTAPGHKRHGKLSLDALNAPGAVLIDDWDIENNSGTTYVFANPRDIITAHTHDTLEDYLRLIAQYQAQGKYVAGYIAYDAGLGLDKPLHSQHQPNVPLLWMGVYDSAQVLDRSEAHFHQWDPSTLVRNPRLDTSKEHYRKCIGRIKDYIAAGDVYQVNHTCKVFFENAGTAVGLFSRLRESHPVCHSAYINASDFPVICISPELFLRHSGGELSSRPMKGTSRRGRSSLEDNALQTALRNDVKNRAENIMIVDLMRNDIGRVCEYGSVSVPNLFRIERYLSLLQMTSEVKGKLRSRLSLPDTLRAVLPAGSITGAPKTRAIEIIDELEQASRGVYCGCIGMFQPGGDYLLNVAIRTIVQRDSTCEMGVGSGIVADSDADAEYEEVLLKSRFLYLEPVVFDLLTTMLYQPSTGFASLDRHILRMSASARYFGYTFDEPSALAALLEAKQRIDSTNPPPEAQFRVRLLSTQSGEVRAEWSAIATSPEAPVRLVLSERRTDPADIYLYHKTTNRRAYDTDLAQARRHGLFDVLYRNTRGELTECAITNICVRIEGKWFTPPVECGLLPGLWREEMLRSEQATERIVTPEDLAAADAITIGNSVRGTIVVDSIQTEAGEILFQKPD